ncbi:hypothetical protein JTE90_008661 [Oedothorax gibbosus]|uniref:Uncharacterized protein n=1 Tax=Oedothorax gibbosus TaxID=931172 RepID=A0AAV6TZ95_9ARAC|nr:hypothetical protein JTE90_008661 [Oedothorax gibbosus]
MAIQQPRYLQITRISPPPTALLLALRRPPMMSPNPTVLLLALRPPPMMSPHATTLLLLLSTSNATATDLHSQQVGTTSDCIDKGIQAIPDFANAKINTVISIPSQILTNDDYSSDTDSGSDDSDSEWEPYPTDEESDYQPEEDFSEDLQMRNLMVKRLLRKT